MMKKLLSGILLFVIALIVFLVATIPAPFALKFMPTSIPVKVQGASGTVWNGQAMQVAWQGYPLGKLQWKLHALPLMLGRIKAHVILEGKGVNATGDVTAYRDQTLILDDTRITTDLTKIPLPRQIPATPDGIGTAIVRHATINNRWPTELDGEVHWNPARILSPMELHLGDLKLMLSSDKGDKLIGKLQGQGTLSTSGKLGLTRNGAFTANIKIAPTDKTPRELRDMLPMIGRPDSKGVITIRQQMQLRGFPL